MQKLFSIGIVFSLILLSIMTSCRVSNSYEALEEYNYFKAKKGFENALKRNTSPAAYGLSVIYYRKDNPFHNMDSAYHYSLMGIENFDELKDKNKLKLAEKHNFTYETMLVHREKISRHEYLKTRSKNTIPAYIEFMAQHPWSELKDSALFHREGLAFEIAVADNSSKSYLRFLNDYPDTRFQELAEEGLERRQFIEATENGTLADYERFLEIYPTNRFAREAHDFIYRQFESENTVKSYDLFIDKYPHNPNIETAWLNLYRLYTSAYTKEAIENFEKENPDFPFVNMIDADLAVVGKRLFPYKWNDKFGYMDENGLPLIPATYENASIFANGLAAVYLNGKYGYIDKQNNVIIDFQFDDAQDFDKGRAIVEIDRYLGVIDRTGHFVIEPIYEDIGNYSEGLCYVYLNDKYTYMNMRGDQVFTTWYNDAYSFNEGRAKVQLGDSSAYIRKDGSFLMTKTGVELDYFAPDIFIYDLQDSVNLISTADTFLLPNFVDRIGNLSENRSIYEKDDAFGYINEKGEVVIPADYATYSNYFQFSQFQNGHAKVMLQGKFGMIDSVGERILPAIFTNIGAFGELIPVTKGKGWGYSDAEAKLQIQYKYDYAYPFEQNISIVNEGGLLGVINSKGEEVLATVYPDIQRLGDTLLRISEDGINFGLFNTQGKQLTPLDYSRFHVLEHDVIQLEAQNRLDYFDITNQKLITLLTEDE